MLFEYFAHIRLGRQISSFDISCIWLYFEMTSSAPLCAWCVLSYWYGLPFFHGKLISELTFPTIHHLRPSYQLHLGRFPSCAVRARTRMAGSILYKLSWALCWPQSISCASCVRADFTCVLYSFSWWRFYYSNYNFICFKNPFLPKLKYIVEIMQLCVNRLQCNACDFHDSSQMSSA